jgi:hypothetical protein
MAYSYPETISATVRNHPPVEIGLTVKTKPALTEPTRATRASDLAAKVIDTLTPGGTGVEEKASRKRRLLKGPEEFREVRVDRAKNK